MPVIDVVLLVLLVIGNTLALPIWWCLFGAPFVRLAKRLARKRKASELTLPSE
jgi:hypothetical protein